MLSRNPLSVVFFVMFALSLPACGGGGGSSDPGPFPGTQATVFPLAAFDGLVRGDNSFARASGIVVGDNGGTQVGIGSRGMLRFDLGRIPPTATITSVILRVYQTEVQGNPYRDLGPVNVRPADLQGAIDGGDWNTGQFSLPYGSISTDATLGYKELDLTSRFSGVLAATLPSLEFALYINGNTVDLDAQADQAVFQDVEGSRGAPNPPQLVVTWTLP